jgi:hypothetical protein
MLGLGPSQTVFFQSSIVTVQKGIHRLMHDVERAVVVSAHGSAYCRIASGRIESYVKLATNASTPVQHSVSTSCTHKCFQNKRPCKSPKAITQPGNNEARVLRANTFPGGNSENEFAIVDQTEGIYLLGPAKTLRGEVNGVGPAVEFLFLGMPDEDTADLRR